MVVLPSFRRQQSWPEKRMSVISICWSCMRCLGFPLNILTSNQWSWSFNPRPSDVQSLKKEIVRFTNRFEQHYMVMVIYRVSTVFLMNNKL